MPFSDSSRDVIAVGPGLGTGLAVAIVAGIALIGVGVVGGIVIAIVVGVMRGRRRRAAMPPPVIGWGPPGRPVGSARLAGGARRTRRGGPDQPPPRPRVPGRTRRHRRPRRLRRRLRTHPGATLEEGQALLCRSALSSTWPPARLSTSTAPLVLLRRNSSPSAPLSSAAFITAPSGRVTRVPAVT